jgi:hypothetical protein
MAETNPSGLPVESQYLDPEFQNELLDLYWKALLERGCPQGNT